MPNTNLRVVEFDQRKSETVDYTRLSAAQREGIYNAVAIYGHPPLTVARRAGVTIAELCATLVEVGREQCRAACSVAKLAARMPLLPPLRAA